jgi:5-methylcytosine-specific restriction protein B
MADPVCRWRNPYVKTIKEFIDILPKTVMPATEARAIINRNFGGNFFGTAYQLACQVGLYYESKDKYYPRFRHDPDIHEVLNYLKNWLVKYYVPNPYTKAGFATLNPIGIHGKLCEYIVSHNGNAKWDDAKKDIFKEVIGNDDILKNTINFYSDVISIENGKLKPRAGIEFEDLNAFINDPGISDRDDKVKFFNYFGMVDANKLLGPEYKHNFIMYGAPGTGKSNELESRSAVFGSRKKRITFYPDYSYAKFAGSYKPVTYYKKPVAVVEFYDTKEQGQQNKDIINEPVIDYAFTPGPFLQALSEAFLSDDPYLLVIEEVNRANAAAVFGEIFQLLDRTSGVSDYKVMLSDEAMLYLKGKLGSEFNKVKDGIYLPSNLYIWATMNSADQGVFHMDAAFKRRWSFEYLPLNKNQAIREGKSILFGIKKYDWNSFRQIINTFLSVDCKIPEDRLIGPFFLSEAELIDSNSIKNKLLLYLRDDVLRHNHRKLFEADTFSNIIELYDTNANIFVQVLMEKLDALTDVSEQQ